MGKREQPIERHEAWQRDQQALTPGERDRQSAYLGLFRAKRIQEIRQLAVGRLTKSGRGTAWKCLRAIPAPVFGVLFEFDLAIAEQRLGPIWPTKDKADNWLAAEAVALADYARRLTDPKLMRVADDHLLRRNRALNGDEAVRRALEKQRVAHQKGARITNERKAQNYKDQYAALHRRFQELGREGLKKEWSVGKARSEAVKQVARENNIAPKRVNEILLECLSR